MTTVAVVGADGFVGSGFASHLASRPEVTLRRITRQNYDRERGTRFDVVIDCSANSRKFLAEGTPALEFDLSVAQRLRTLHDFPAERQLHISSVDVYGQLDSEATTREDQPLDPAQGSHYGFHKRLAEDLVKHYAARWLIVRLAGMVGAGLRKNPIYDVLHGQPQRIHPDSLYQFLDTLDVAQICWNLLEQGAEGETFNVCGDGVVSPREIARWAGCELNLEGLAPEARPRVVTIDIAKIKARATVRRTIDVVHGFLANWTRGRPIPGAV